MLLNKTTMLPNVFDKCVCSCECAFTKLADCSHCLLYFLSIASCASESRDLWTTVAFLRLLLSSAFAFQILAMHFPFACGLLGCSAARALSLAHALRNSDRRHISLFAPHVFSLCSRCTVTVRHSSFDLKLHSLLVRLVRWW